MIEKSTACSVWLLPIYTRRLDLQPYRLSASAMSLFDFMM
jgi:hypothetical protein